MLVLLCALAAAPRPALALAPRKCSGEIGFFAGPTEFGGALGIDFAGYDHRLTLHLNRTAGSFSAELQTRGGTSPFLGRGTVSDTGIYPFAGSLDAVKLVFGTSCSGCAGSFKICGRGR